MAKNDDLKMRFIKDAAKAMKAKKLTQSGIANATGLKYHVVHDCITRGAIRLTDNVQKIADYLEIDVSYLQKPAVSKAKVTKKMMNDGRYIVTTKGEKFERTEIMTKEQVEEMEGKEEKATVEPVEVEAVPTMTDESPGAEAERRRAVHLGGWKEIHKGRYRKNAGRRSGAASTVRRTGFRL